MSKLSNALNWGQFLLALIIGLIAGTLAFASVKENVSLLQQKDTFLEKNILEIKDMLKEEMDRHHPRIP